jgi:anti-sigma B factor antagonist
LETMPLGGEQHGQVYVVRMPPRVDAVGADALRADLEALMGPGAGPLLLDMSAVKFIDSTGLGVIVAAMKTGQSQGGTVALFAMPPKVRTLVEVTRLHLVFDIYPDEAAALAAFA